jgi:hypothetical protein
MSEALREQDASSAILAAGDWRLFLATGNDEMKGISNF